MKLGRIADNKFRDIVKKLSGQTGLSVKTAYKLKNIVIKNNAEFEKFEDLRMDIINKHSAKNPDGSLIIDEIGNAQILKDSLQDFLKEIDALKAIEVDIGSVALSELEGAKDLSADDLLVLDTLITE